MEALTCAELLPAGRAPPPRPPLRCARSLFREARSGGRTPPSLCHGGGAVSAGGRRGRRGTPSGPAPCQAPPHRGHRAPREAASAGQRRPGAPHTSHPTSQPGQRGLRARMRAGRTPTAGTRPEREATVRIREQFSPRLMKSLLSSGLRPGSPYLAGEASSLCWWGIRLCRWGRGSQRDCDTQSNLKRRAPSSLVGPRMPDGPRPSPQPPSAGQEPGPKPTAGQERAGLLSLPLLDGGGGGAC